MNPLPPRFLNHQKKKKKKLDLSLVHASLNLKGLLIFLSSPSNKRGIGEWLDVEAGMCLIAALGNNILHLSFENTLSSISLILASPSLLFDHVNGYPKKWIFINPLLLMTSLGLSLDELATGLPSLFSSWLNT